MKSILKGVVLLSLVLSATACELLFPGADASNRVCAFEDPSKCTPALQDP